MKYFGFGMLIANVVAIAIASLIGRQINYDAAIAQILIAIGCILFGMALDIESYITLERTNNETYYIRPN